MNPDQTDGPRPRFLCDAMLGSLARWLRLFGFDTAYPQPGAEDRVLADRARSEDRWLLTRDCELAAYGPRSMLVRATKLDDQLVEVLTRLDLKPVANLENARCADCNGELETADRESVREVVPPHVFETAPRFRRCRWCSRVYWPGSHVERISKRMEAVAERVVSGRVVS